MHNAAADEACRTESADAYFTPTTTVLLPTYPVTDYLLPQDAVLDCLSGEDSDPDVPSNEKTLEEVNNLVGVTLTERMIAGINNTIDKVLIHNETDDGYCTYFAILNGLFVKKFQNTTKWRSEEVFARGLPAIYDIVYPYKEELWYATLLNVTAIIFNINDALVHHGYALNIYERKNKTYLLDIKTRSKTKRHVLSVVKALYWYVDFEEKNPTYVQLIFSKVEGLWIWRCVWTCR